MLKGNSRTIFRIAITLVFLGVGVKFCFGGEYLHGVIAMVAGAAFIAALFLKRNGKKG